MTRLPGLLVLAVVTACTTPAPVPPMDPIQAHAAAEPAIRALRDGDFAAATSASDQALRDNRGNAVAAAVHALASYQRAGEKLRDALTEILDGAEHMRGFDHRRGRAAWTEFASALAAIDDDLAIAGNDPAFALELCLACWSHDWNHTGEVDANDRLLFQIEVDGRGDELPEADPRRSPTFRFDAGDIAWARAMIAFQRAAAELVLAYKWDGLDALLGMGDMPGKLRIALDDPGRIQRARELIRTGLGFSDRSRELYLAETDDDREWVPNPRQADHAVPLVMDAAMYDTWAAVTRDVRALIDGKEGIDLRDAIGPSLGLTGFIDVGELFDHPRDITLDFSRLLSVDEKSGIAALARQLLGPALVDQMTKSPLPGRLLRMAHEIDNDEDTFDRKLRYFLWIN